MSNLANALTAAGLVRQSRLQTKAQQQLVQLAQADIRRLQQEAYNAGYRHGHYDGWHEGRYQRNTNTCTCPNGCEIHGGQFGGDT